MTPSTNAPAVLTEFDDAGADEIDSAMDLLANRQRRAALRYLERANGSATVSEVARAIAAESRTPDPAVVSDHAGAPSQETRRVRLSLHHAHVPKLVAANAIEYDPETETLALRERGRTLLNRQEAVCGPLR
ncbi:DUF7344 domain-containing protein [Haloterrigena alkaliphila]|uniref:DUF7344 domain-containing protein n=1 Tax=Haloterrigena alkaliphila TaxID=2816475 RepID=A0A8A2VF73_9EURY|nr:hypothetical protein [Haloterrigena alkaliphila]QSW99002.1 hypothetical protein J0X25_16705 [Haloterrigena alkaliphila]